MKKWFWSLAAAAWLCCSFGTAAYAHTQTDVNVSSDGVVDINLTSDYGQAMYVIYFLEPGTRVTDISGGSSDAFAGLEQLQSVPEEGQRYSSQKLLFALDAGAEYGIYTAVFGGGELSGKEVRFAYPDPGVSAQAAAAVNGAASSAALEAALLQYQNTAWVLDMDTIYKSAKNIVLENMAAILDGGAVTAGDVADAWQKACVLAELKTCSAENLYDQLFLGESCLGIAYEDMVNEESAELQRVFNGLRRSESMTTPQELQKVLRSAEAVARVNAATRDQILQVLQDCSDVFQLNFNGDFQRVDAYQLSKKLVVSSKPYDSPEEVKTTFEEAVKTLANTTSNSNIGGSAGGGPSRGTIGGGGVSSVSGEHPVNNPEVTSDRLQQIEGQTVFSDLEAVEWAKPFIYYLQENHIMQGDGDGRFRPEDPVLREELLKLVLEALKLSAPADDDTAAAFEDVESGAWYAAYVQTGVKLGVVNGMEEKRFGVGEAVSRQDAAVMILRAVEAAGSALQTTKEAIAFADTEAIAGYAREAIDMLQRAGVINGYETGEFCPQNSILRCEAAKMIYQMMKSTGGGKE